MQNKKKWSFDNSHIGLLNDTGNVVSVKIIPRPVGLTNDAWFTHAAHVCRLLERMLEE